MGLGHGGAARRDAQLGEDGGDVVVDGLGRDEQARADLVVGQTATQCGGAISIAAALVASNSPSVVQPIATPTVISAA